MFNFKKKTARGFSLIESVLYIAIAMSLVSALGFLTVESYNIRARNQVVTEVDQQGALVTQIIAGAIRESLAVTEPTAGTSATQLVLSSEDVLKDPIVFTLSDGVLLVSEAGDSAVALTNSRISVSDLSFKNLSLVPAPDSIEFIFTLTYQNPESFQAYDYTEIFYGAANRR